MPLLDAAHADSSSTRSAPGIPDQPDHELTRYAIPSGIGPIHFRF